MKEIVWKSKEKEIKLKEADDLKKKIKKSEGKFVKITEETFALIGNGINIYISLEKNKTSVREVPFETLYTAIRKVDAVEEITERQFRTVMGYANTCFYNNIGGYINRVSI